MEDSWCRYLPHLHRTLADPEVGHALPRSYISLGFDETCAWWETLRYLFRALLGWRHLPAGLAWWYAAGKPTLDDPRLRLVLERWDTRQELDFFAAREWESGGVTGMGTDGLEWPVSIYEPRPDWWRDLKSRSIAGYPSPYGGGYNPLHLGHSDEVGDERPVEPSTGHHDIATRRAVVIVSGFGSWRRELCHFGAVLPDLGEHSWHVEVFDRRGGYLGLFRQSRVTGRWFQGKHSIHIVGNPTPPPTEG